MKKARIKRKEKRYTYEEEIAITKGLFNFFDSIDDPMPEAVADTKERICVMDPRQISMVVAKSQRAKRVLRRFVERDNKIPNTPNITEFCKKLRQPATCDYPLEDLKNIIYFFEKANDVDGYRLFVTLLMGTDTPLCIKNKDWSIWVAPRIEPKEMKR